MSAGKQSPTTTAEASRTAAGPVQATCGPEEHARRLRRSKPMDDEAFQRAASLFHVVSDVARLKLLDRLCDGEWCVSELAEAAGVALSTVSQQLRTLRAEHIVERRRAGKHIYYSLADRHVIDLVSNALAHAAEDPSAGVGDRDDFPD